MKRSVLFFPVMALLLAAGMTMATAQDQPGPKKDTVNMDTDAKPEFYYTVEDEASSADAGKSGTKTIAIIAGAVIVLVGAGFLMLKKKK